MGVTVAEQHRPAAVAAVASPGRYGVSVYYVDFLTEAHRRLTPQAYLEIGVANGKTLTLARACPAVGIDPDYRITVELHGRVSLFRTSSDEYFARGEPLAATGGLPFDLAFIDGLHLFEFALRDFVNTERNCSSRGVILFDDVLPRTVDEAARSRHTRSWTGDVFHILAVLARYRPDLCVVPLNTSPTGLLAVFGLDPLTTVLREHYDEIVAACRRPDPQQVPEDVLDRGTLVPPQRFLDAGLFEALGGLPVDAPAGDVADVLQPRVARFLGRAFGGQLTR